MNTRTRSSGFTLFELLVSVVLIVTVVGIVYGSVMTASRTSERTRQRLGQSQRSALALDQIARLWRCRYQTRATSLPSEYDFTVNRDVLLRFVSLSPWGPDRDCQPILNQLILNKKQLVLSQAMLTPDYQTLALEAEPQILLDHVTQVRVLCYQDRQWLASPTVLPDTLQVDLETTGESGLSHHTFLVMTTSMTQPEVSP